MRKSVKSTKNKKTTQSVKSKQIRVVHTRAQRFWGMVALACLFICGVMVGTGLNTPKEEPVAIAENLLLSPENISFSDVAVGSVYERNVRISAPAPVKIVALRQSKDVPEMNIETTCVAQEILDPSQGCMLEITYAPTTETYAGNNVLIVDWMSADGVVHNTGIVIGYSASRKVANPDRVCEHVENAMLARLPEEYATLPYEERIVRAQIYASLSERGCPENSETYVDKAEQELAIARALTDDEFDDIEEVEVAETYERLHAVADQILDTAKKLTTPAIDFVVEVEKVINEQ